MKCPYRTVKELKVTPTGIAETHEFNECLYNKCPFYIDSFIQRGCLRASKEVEKRYLKNE